jgi:hypothetical protein
MIDWSKVKNFKEKEFTPPNYSGEVDMNLGFVLKLDLFRSHVGSPITIHENGGFSVKGHSENSLHYSGLAADLHVTQAIGPRDVIEQALLAYKWTFLSIGIYPYWNRPGLHLDDRSAIGKEKVVWFRDKGGLYQYYSYNRFYECIKDLVIHMEKHND